MRFLNERFCKFNVLNSEIVTKYHNKMARFRLRVKIMMKMKVYYEENLIPEMGTQIFEEKKRFKLEIDKMKNAIIYQNNNISKETLSL